MTGSTRPELRDRPRTPIPVRATARRRWLRPTVVVLVTFGLVAVAVGALSALRAASVPAVGDVAIVSTATDALGVDYADAPSVSLVNYDHGREISYAVEVRNEGPLSVVVEEVPIAGVADERRLVRPTDVLLAPEDARGGDAADGARPFEPFRLEPGAARTVIVNGVFDNCVYYTERAMELIASQAVTWSVAGLSTTTDVELSRRFAVRSPHMRNCPGRVMDRGARTRTGIP